MENENRRVEDAARLPAEKLEWKACVCGEPSTAGTTHRTDGPCHVTQSAAPVVDAAELDKLKALAVAATPGEWKIGTFGQLNVQDGKYMLRDPDAEYIRAAQPSAILRIAALVAQQAARIEELEGMTVTLSNGNAASYERIERALNYFDSVEKFTTKEGK